MKAPKDFERKSKFYTKKKAKSLTDFYLSNPNRIKKRIRIARQSITVEKHNLQVSSKGLTLPELLTKLNHPVAFIKQKALSGILELTKRNTIENHYNIGVIAHSIWSFRWNNDQKIRRISDEILKLVLGLADGSIWFYKIAIIYLTEGYSNPSHHIVRDALEFTDFLIKKRPEILHSLSTNLIILLLKINSPENTPLQCHLIHEITRIHSYKTPSFLHSDSIETLLFNANSINNINFYQRTLELALDVFSHSFYQITNEDVMKRLKILLECAILVKESLTSSKDLIHLVKHHSFTDCLPNITQLNAKQRRSADEIISHLLVIKWSIELLFEKKPALSITQVESECLSKVINSQLTIPLAESINALINYILIIDNIDEFEIMYNKVKQLNTDGLQISANKVETYGSIIELVISSIHENLPTLLIEQVLSQLLNNNKSTCNTTFGKTVQDMSDIFRIHIANIAKSYKSHVYYNF